MRYEEYYWHLTRRLVYRLPFDIITYLFYILLQWRYMASVNRVWCLNCFRAYALTHTTQILQHHYLSLCTRYRFTDLGFISLHSRIWCNLYLAYGMHHEALLITIRVWRPYLRNRRAYRAIRLVCRNWSLSVT